VRISIYISVGVLLFLLSGCGTGRQAWAPPESAGDRLATEYLKKAHEYERKADMVRAYRYFKLARTVAPSRSEAVEGVKRLERELRRLATAHYEKGMRYQRQGKYGMARHQFLIALRLRPGYADVVELLTERKRFRTKRYVEHTIRPGESLSKIAKLYYGDVTKFPIIAQYNNLTDATRIRAGQRIKVPEIEGLEFLVEEEQIEAEKQYFYDQGQWDWESSLLETGSAPLPEDPGGLQTAFYRDYGKDLFKKGMYNEAIREFRKVLDVYPRDKTALEYSSRAHFLIATSLLEKKEYLPARDEFKRALGYNRDCRQCQRLMKKSENLYKEHHYKRGMKYYGEEKLVEAMGEWELVKKIDPNYKRLDYLIKKAKNILEKLEEIRESKEKGEEKNVSN